ncbi:MAG: VWA domain-containing protein [Runella slithyformis]|nr:MAG: VWA domain-containing protein [Runella slithyformis]
MYFLISVWGTGRPKYSAMKFVLYTFFGSLFMLAAILAVYYCHFMRTGSLTMDMGALGLFVQSLSTAQTSSAGTDVCQALALAVEKQLTNTKADNTTKILLLLTDGEDFGTCDRRLLTKIRQYGMHLIIVGVGTQTGGTVKVGPNLLKDEDGQVVITRLNGTYLRELAIATNGQYFEMSPKTSVLSNIRAAIDTVQGRLIDSRKVTVNSNKYRYFLVVALVLLLLDVLATVTTFQI